MPAYEVEHVCPLTVGQQDDLAEAITKIHSDQFKAPRLFVNVRFTNIENQATYVAGKRRKANRIFAYVRHGPSRTQEDYDTVSAALTKAWNSIVPLPQVRRGVEAPDTELRLIMYYGVYQGRFVDSRHRVLTWYRRNCSRKRGWLFSASCWWRQRVDQGKHGKVSAESR